MSYKVLKCRPANKKQGVTSDQIIQVMHRGKPLELRRVSYRDPETRNHYVFLTNHVRLSAKTIA